MTIGFALFEFSWIIIIKKIKPKDIKLKWANEEHSFQTCHFRCRYCEYLFNANLIAYCQKLWNFPNICTIVKTVLILIFASTITVYTDNKWKIKKIV